jgi:hypothetical protein
LVLARVADLLERKGHKVFTPTLTGVGDLSHLLSKDIVLNTHITDIVNLVKWEDLNPIYRPDYDYIELAAARHQSASNPDT